MDKPGNLIVFIATCIEVVCKFKYKITKETSNNKSLTKLNVKALKLDFNVDLLLCQKLIKKNEVNPINSQPKNNVKKFADSTKITILKIKAFNQKINPISSASFLK